MKRLPLVFVALTVLIIGTILGFLIPRTSKPNSEEPRQDQSISQVEGEKVSQQLSSPKTSTNQSIKVVRVIDGDTIEIEGGQKVRYIGIDTPELVDPRKPVQCFAQEASLKNKELIEGKTIELEKDISETDKYGRLLRYVYLPAEASAKAGVDGVFVNDYLVREGFAHASSYPPDIKYQEQFSQAEQEAQEFNRGLWGKCTGVNQPISNSPNQTANAKNGCLIKGNISSSGEKIYHIPGQYYYEKTVIDESRGEKWFCTEEEAIAAGWRKSKK